MIKHIVMWNLAEEAEGVGREENGKRLKKVLETLPAAIPEIHELEVGLNQNPSPAGCDVVLYTAFENWAALRTYQAHPDHQEVVALVGKITSDRHVVDYETG